MKYSYRFEQKTSRRNSGVMGVQWAYESRQIVIIFPSIERRMKLKLNIKQCGTQVRSIIIHFSNI